MSNENGKFFIYNHLFVLKDNEKITRQFITYKDSEGVLHFTDYHKYIKSPNQRIKRINTNGNTRYMFITQLLNYAFLYRNTTSLNQLDSTIVKDFIRLYGMCELPDDDEETHRSKDTVNRCVQYILDFITLLSRDQNKKCNITPDDLYRWGTKRNKNGKVEKVKIPDFDIYYRDNGTKPIYRDIPNAAFNMLFSHIAQNHTELLGLLILSAFAGLRPSEACNCRREDSPLGAGIQFDIVNDELWGVTIDLRKEYNLRSDLVSIGNIKKERLQSVPKVFLKAFRDSYNIYTSYISGRKYEADYGPFTTNTQGKAMTYTRYWQLFRNIIKNEMIPMYLASDDPEIVMYGRILLDYNLSPHVFRHWYTVQLVLSGVNEPGVLMHLRGDKNPESAITYLNEKSELAKKYQKFNSENFDYLLWAAGKLE